jgi:hypothetical protein
VISGRILREVENGKRDKEEKAFRRLEKLACSVIHRL